MVYREVRFLPWEQCLIRSCARHESVHYTMKIIGLEQVKVITVYNGDYVATTETFSIGDGQWSLEALNRDGHCLKEFVGNNGTREGDECDDLYSLYESWARDVHHQYRVLRAPDGMQASLSWFRREINKGRLHGLIVSF